MADFLHFDEIDLSSEQTGVCLTLDIDWAHDEVVKYSLDKLVENNVKATIFCTHETRVLDPYRENRLFQWGLHPNFNQNFEVGHTVKYDLKVCLENLARIVGHSTSYLRSHSLTFSTRWLSTLASMGFTHLSNYAMIGSPNAEPFRHINELMELPIYIADDGFLAKFGCFESVDVDKYLMSTAPKVKVIDFHPIHIFINTPNIEYYDEVKVFGRDIDKLKTMRYAGDGIETFFDRVLALRT